MPKVYNETRVAVKTVNAKGEEEVNVYSEERAKELTDKNEGEWVKIQTFLRHEAETTADFAVLVPQEQQVVNLFQVGYGIKEARIMREVMLNDTDSVEGTYDLQAETAELSERRKLTPVDKAKKILAMLSPEQFAELLRDFESAKA